MNPNLTAFLLSQTILLAGLVGVFKWPKISSDFRPFVLVCLTISCNEIIRFLLISQQRYDYVSYNLFILLTALLYIWMFFSWGLFRKPKWLLPLTAGLVTAWWVAEHFLIQGYQMEVRTPYFRMLFSLLQVVMSVVFVNGLIVSEKGSLIRNPKFLICAALIIYYTYRILVDAFGFQGLSKTFLANMGNFNRYLVQLMNLLFLIAALWIPRKKSFILPS
jgi:hypothetical protein